MSNDNDSNTPSGETPAQIRLAQIQDKIAGTAKVAERKPHEVELIAISKTRNADEITPLIEAGQRVFGENRVQEAQGKWPELKRQWGDIRLHMVGQLQSNKAADALELFDAIHSLDRPSLAKKLALAMRDSGRRIPCYIQVNIGDEAQKGGCAIADLPEFLAQTRALEIPVIGLMAVPPAGVEPAPYFALLYKLAREHGLPRLSMGMSGDYETAIRLGATSIRIGTVLFGAREPG